MKKFLKEFMISATEMELERVQLTVKNNELEQRIASLRSLDRTGKLKAEIAKLEIILKTGREMAEAMRQVIADARNEVFA